MNQTVTPPTAEQEAWIQGQLAEARKFVDAFSPEDAEEPLTVGALDRALAAWLSQDVTDSTRVDAAIHAVGVAFGQLLADGLAMRWVLVEGAGGRTLAVHGLPGRGDVLVYPVKAVTERWEARSKESFEQSYYQISRRITKIAGSQEEKKPWWKFW
jgi:hypothetical protein